MICSSTPLPIIRLYQLLFVKDNKMEAQDNDVVPLGQRVKATFELGSESFAVNSCKGYTISEQLVSMKEESMSILKEFITKHNVPNDVADELVESPSEEDEIPDKPNVKSKKTKLT